ncbi:MAG TPA: alanine--glyoxylate aminotransferase family protein [Acidobacteriota bacterium]|nr:alanine--glyoxylate aminotransferase family protein [Acidobacteriota bacterium]
MIHKRLFIPGPVEVRPEMLLALARPQYGHRTQEWKDTYKGICEKLQKVLKTQQTVMLYTSSSSGAWETAVRQGSLKKILCTTCGAFSERWQQTAELNGIPHDTLAFDWGKGVKTAEIDKALATGQYDAVTYVMNETSTGIRNPIEEVCALLKSKYPDVFIMVDAVSAMAGEDIPVDDLGIDMIFAGLQKCFGLPAGLTVVMISDRFFERAKEIKTPGFYFNALKLKGNHDKHQTLTTPSIPQAFALDAQLDDMFVEGLENRYKRHAEMAAIVQAWAKEHFAMFSEEGYYSKTVSCIDNTKGVSIADLNKELAKHNAMISNGYGKLKETCFRIAHMADTQIWEILGILALIERVLGFKKWV